MNAKIDINENENFLKGNLKLFQSTFSTRIYYYLFLLFYKLMLQLSCRPIEIIDCLNCHFYNINNYGCSTSI